AWLHVTSILLSSSTSCGIGEQTTYKKFTPSSALPRLCLSAYSASTAWHPEGALAASSLDLYMARTLDSLRIASSKTALPTLPLAPVIRIIFFSPLYEARRSPLNSGGLVRAGCSRPWYKHRRPRWACAESSAT